MDLQTVGSVCFWVLFSTSTLWVVFCLMMMFSYHQMGEDKQLLEVWKSLSKSTLYKLIDDGAAFAPAMFPVLSLLYASVYSLENKKGLNFFESLVDLSYAGSSFWVMVLVIIAGLVAALLGSKLTLHFMKRGIKDA